VADDDLYATLMRFHREVVVPDFRDALETRISASEEKLHNEAITIADGIYKRFDRVESEIVSLGAGITRLEERITVHRRKARSGRDPLGARRVGGTRRRDATTHRELKSTLNQH